MPGLILKIQKKTTD